MSDHFSGPRALAGPAGDIADVYAFPSPARPGHLVLTMTVHPLASVAYSFSDGIVYRFRLRPLSVEADRLAFPFGPSDSELAFTCTFEAAQHGLDGSRPVQYGTLKLPWGETVRFRVDDQRGGEIQSACVFAGLRSDPFFIDLPAHLESIAAGRLAFTHPGTNSLLNFNVLSLIIEVDTGALLREGRGPLFGIVGETIVDARIPVRLERVGRQEVKNVIMSMKEFDLVNRDLEIRDIYNLEDPFHLSKDYRGAYRARLNANLCAIDCLDGVRDWPLGPHGAHPLTDLLLDDYLVVDVSKPFADDACLEIERAVLDGREHQTCGGRWFNDDVMDTLYTLLITAGHGPRISDGVDQATVPASNIFPFLMPPNPLEPQQLDMRTLAASLGVQDERS